jgi:Ca2+-binding RTX toxin-like protein
VQLTATPDRAETHAVASPDGSRLAYVQRTPTTHTLVIADPQARSPRPLVTLEAMSRPDWSPDSTALVFATRDGIWAIGADGTALRRLRASGLEPVYSPDGSRIVFVDEGDVWTMAADGVGARRVTETPPVEFSPAWQPAEAAVQAAGTAPCAITGTAGDDVLVGTSGVDAFVDSAGNDTIRALDGDDVVLDGPGDDVIIGGDDDDAVSLREGRNRVDGGPGDDTIAPAVVVVDEPQTVVGGAGFDRLRGGHAADRLAGGAGRDLVAGGGGGDRLEGGSAPDELIGASGNDLLLARDGAADRVSGGGGIDRARVDRIDRRTGVERVLRG